MSTGHRDGQCNLEPDGENFTIKSPGAKFLFDKISVGKPIITP